MTQKLSMSKFKRSKEGGIEGLPLQLMIIILVATLGTAIIIGWMGSLEAPPQIGSVNVDSGMIKLDQTSATEHYTDSGYVKIYVTDQNGNGLPGATVVLKGCGALTSEGKTVYGDTDANGYVVFNDVHISLRGSTTGHISVEVSKSGYGTNSTARVQVVA
jgi:hypothetical protein